MKKIFYSKLWGLMLPIVLQNLMLALVAVADAFIQCVVKPLALALNLTHIYTSIISISKQ